METNKVLEYWSEADYEQGAIHMEYKWYEKLFGLLLQGICEIVNFIERIFTRR